MWKFILSKSYEEVFIVFPGFKEMFISGDSNIFPHLRGFDDLKLCWRSFMWTLRETYMSYFDEELSGIVRAVKELY